MGWLAITDFRRPFVDYTIPYFKGEVTYMIAKKFSTHDQSFDFSNTDYPSMALLMLTAFCMSVIVGLLTKLVAANGNKYAPCWSILQCFIQKGNEDEPCNLKQQILFIIWLFAGIITAATVGGQLVSMLAGQPPKPIATLRELAEAKHITNVFITSKPPQIALKVN